MKILEVKIEEVKPYLKNPRKNQAIEKVANSIKEFGFRQPIVVDKDNVIIAGHTRFAASKFLGLKKVPIHVADNLTETQIQAYRIADNRVAQDAEWDASLLGSELEELSKLDFDLDLLGFETNEIDNLIINNTPTSLVDEDEVPEYTLEKPKAEKGKVYQLGRHRIMCGDCTDPEDVAKLMGDTKANMIFTDPPYNADYSSRVDKNRRKAWGGIMNDNLSNKHYAIFITKALINLDENIEDGGAVYICTDWKSYITIANAFEVNWKQKSMLIWNKNYFGLGTYYRTKHEIIIFGVKGDKFNTWNAEHDEMDVWDEDRERNKNYVHPTQKPVSLPERAIKNSSPLSGTVLDFFSGSGTTLIACEKTGRTCYTMELDPRYVDISIQRWENYVGKDASS
jgi:DNA modification methylase